MTGGADIIEVSVVIPCFNRQALVGEAIESALRQGPGIEVIVVDDGSTDDSWAVIGRFGERVRAFRTGNAGVSAARNFGTQQARGRFIRFLDSDDLIPAGGIRAHVAVAETLPEKQVAVGDAASIDRDGVRIASHGYGYAGIAPPGPLSRSALLSHTMSPFLPLFPAEALHECGGFDTSLCLGEDQELALRLAARGYVFVRAAVLVYEVREHSGERLSRNLDAAGYARLLAFYRHILDGQAPLREAPLSGAEKGAFARRIWATARSASRDGHAAEAEQLFEFATALAGRRAWHGNWGMRALYTLVAPATAERLAEIVKHPLARARPHR